jgi:alkanesulfonate monooxygenase SsuD/methylene tetrahydromethanopterin reductase-like flavin-dependent oxidoreductase (luciferase family)
MLALAVRAEQFNYHRYLFAERHGTTQLASSALEIPAASVLAGPIGSGLDPEA